mmetsp:Transcript_42101/g.134522  ORF Transcript_42101/g.134522 Transcript_42101/m.134522 type:complete len:256 (-) Transcript_42101:2976-3743(-)
MAETRAPPRRSTWSARTAPWAAARCMGHDPSSITSSTSAPLEMSTAATSAWSFSAATCSAEEASRDERALGSAPAASSAGTTLMLPLSHATWSSGRPPVGLALGSAPAPRRAEHAAGCSYATAASSPRVSCSSRPGSPSSWEIMISTTSTCPLRAAVARGVSPSSFRAARLAPGRERRYRTVSARPSRAAQCRGVVKSAATAPGSAPARTSDATISVWPHRAAAWRGVSPSSSRRLWGLSPSSPGWSRSSCTTFK